MSKTSHLNGRDLERLRRALLARRNELMVSLRKGRPVETQATDEIEQGDLAEQAIEQESALERGQLDERTLADIEHALAKIDRGTYGVSEVNGQPIPLERLNAMPWARRTLQEEERNAKSQ
jgi:DnaK suppressor protein